MEVPALKPFDISDWNAIVAAFKDAPSLPLGQAWREENEEKLRPGVTLVGWQGDTLYVWARLTDDHIFTLATEDNQMLYQLGDVFELFLRETTRENYVELHLAPSGHRLQLCFPQADTIKQLRGGDGEIDDFLCDTPLFHHAVRSVAGGWEVFAAVPLSALGSTETSLAGRSILASFSRYDYADKDSAPVLSSTSAHKELNYHRQEEWKELTFS